MEACIKDIKMWMAVNHLKLNDNKTEVITFTAPNVEMNMPIDVIHIGDYSIPPVKCVRDLGVVFDHHMTMHENITKTCASCYFHLWNISSIRDSLTDEATIQLEIALAACEVSHNNIQSSAAYLQGTARHGTKLLEDCCKVTCLLAHWDPRLEIYSSCRKHAAN